MLPVYKIEIQLYPNNDIEKSQPFFWCLQSCWGKDWCTEIAGWESSIDSAWQTAYSYYEEYYNNENK